MNIRKTFHANVRQPPVRTGDCSITGGSTQMPEGSSAVKQANPAQLNFQALSLKSFLATLQFHQPFKHDENHLSGCVPSN